MDSFYVRGNKYSLELATQHRLAFVLATPSTPILLYCNWFWKITRVVGINIFSVGQDNKPVTEVELSRCAGTICQ
jgi:hypothetical protein